jgi:hypothetical protein
MAISAAQRRTLEAALQSSLGAEAAAIMIDYLPAGGADALATRADLEQHERATRVDLEQHQRTTRVDLERLEERVGARFEVLEERLGGKIEALRADFRGEVQALRADLRGDIEALRADFRGELLGAVQAQTRTLLLGMVGAVTSLTALAYALSRIFPAP